ALPQRCVNRSAIGYSPVTAYQATRATCTWRRHARITGSPARSSGPSHCQHASGASGHSTSDQNSSRIPRSRRSTCAADTWEAITAPSPGFARSPAEAERHRGERGVSRVGAGEAREVAVREGELVVREVAADAEAAPGEVVLDRAEAARAGVHAVLEAAGGEARAAGERGVPAAAGAV